MRYCTQPRCTALVEAGRCPAHEVQREHQRPNWDVRRWYRTDLWLRLRALVLQEEPICKLCLVQGRTVPSTDVDHIVKHEGKHERFFDRNNLQGLCHACHSRKTQAGG